MVPEGIFTAPDERETNPLLSSETVPFTPAARAGEFNVMVPVTVLPTPTLFELNVSVMIGRPTLIVAKPGLNPVAEPVMLVDPTLSGVIVAAALSAPARTIMVGGADTTVESSTVIVMLWPVGPAGAPNVKVNVPGMLTRLRGS